MKKYLPALLFSLLAAAGSYATQIWSDPMNYPVGDITTNLDNGTPIWIRHSGSGNDSFEVNYAGSAAAKAGHRYEVNQTRSDDIHRWFYPVDTNTVGSGTLYASFIVSLSAIPGNAGGTYFAHFMEKGTTYRGRIFAVVPPNPYPYTNAPNTYRLGVSGGTLGDYDPTTGSGGPGVVVPVDLALNTDYQVVLKFIIDDGNPSDADTAYIYVNPTGESDTANSAGPTTDAATTTALAAFAFRQASGEGILEIGPVMVGDSFADVADMSTNLPPCPVIGLQPVNVTNYSGNPAFLEVCAAGTNLSYQWYQVTDGQVTNTLGTGQKLYFNSLQTSQQGTYFCTVSGSSCSTTSTTAYVSVNGTLTSPTFTLQPKNTTTNELMTVTLTSSAYGTGPLTYQWYFSNSIALSDGVTADGASISGSTSPNLTIAQVGTNEAGPYKVTVTGGQSPAATSTNGVLTVLPANPVSIAYLRMTTVDTNTWQVTNTTSKFYIRGVITVFTNLTSGYASYYVQDGTGGFNLFVNDATFRPNMGDIVEAYGPLTTYRNNMEINLSSTDPTQFYRIVTPGGTALPAPRVFYPYWTNNAALMETNIEGKVVMLTNVYFPSGTSSASYNTTITCTNGGMPILVYFACGADLDVRSQPYPPFAWTVTGVMNQYYNSSSYSSYGYEVNVSRWADIQTNPPPAFSVTAVQSGTNVVLSWPVTPYSTLSAGAYAYSVLAATSVAGPYLPLATGLTFTNTTATYTDAAGGSAKYYKVSSP